MSLLPPVAALAPRGVEAQEPIEIHRFSECARLGIAFAPTDPLVVEQLLPGSPAARAGLEPHDTVLAVDGVELNRAGLPELSRRLRPGVAVRLRIARDRRVREVEVVPVRDLCVETVHAPAGALARTERLGAPFSEIRVYRIERDTPYVWPFDDEWRRRFIEEMRAHEAEMDSLLRWLRVDQQRRLDSLRRSLSRAEREWAEQGERIARRLHALQLQHEDDGAGWIAISTSPSAYPLPLTIRVGRRAVAGVEFTELNPQLAAYFQGAEHGLLVLQVAPGTPGANIGLQPGDVVVRAGDNPVRTIADLREAIAGAGREPVTLTIVRRGEERRLVYRPER